MTAAEVIPLRSATPFRAVEWAKSIPSGMLMSGKRVDTTARHVLLLLATYANNDNGIAWPSQETLAVASGWEPKTIREALKRLEHAGLISHVGDRGAKQWLLAVDRTLPDARDVRAEQSQRRRALTAARVRAHRARQPESVPVTQSETVTGNAVEQRYIPDVTPPGSVCNAVVDRGTTKEQLLRTELREETCARDEDQISDALFDVPEQETSEQRHARYVKLYLAEDPMANRAGLKAALTAAMKAGYDDETIVNGLMELAHSQYSPTKNSLSVAIKKTKPKGNGNFRIRDNSDPAWSSMSLSALS